MTNKEGYLDELIKIWETGHQFGLIDGNITTCSNYRCNDCTFCKSKTCVEGREDWLKKEFKAVKASTLPVDTRIVLHTKSTGGIFNRYFSHFTDDCIYYFCNGTDSWSSKDVGTTPISALGTYTVTLEDGTPVMFE